MSDLLEYAQDIDAILGILLFLGMGIVYLLKRAGALKKVVTFPWGVLKRVCLIVLDWKNRRADAAFGQFLALMVFDCFLFNRIARHTATNLVETGEPSTIELKYLGIDNYLGAVICHPDAFLERSCGGRRVSKHLRRSFLFHLSALKSELHHQGPQPT